MYPQNKNPYLNKTSNSTVTLPGLPTYWKNIKDFFTKKGTNPQRKYIDYLNESPNDFNNYTGTRGGIKYYADPAKVNSLPVGMSYNDMYNPDGSKKNNNVDTAGINSYLNSLGKEPNRVYTYGANGEMYNYAGDLIYKPTQENTASTSSKDTFINNQTANNNNNSTPTPTYSNSYTPENGGFIRGNDGTYTYKSGTNTNNQSQNTSTQSRSDIAFQNYINTLSLGDDERNALLGLTNLQNQAAQESEQARYSGETSGFAAGEQERVNRNNNLAINAATNRYNAFRDIADRKSNVARLEYERALQLDKDANGQKTGYQDQFTLGNSRYGVNPATGEYEIIATAPKSSGGSSSSSGTKKESTAVSMGNDVIDALDFLQTQKESNNWKGINPDNYNYYRNQLIRTYGSSAATLFDKEFKNRGLEVDNTDYNKQNWFQRNF